MIQVANAPCSWGILEFEELEGEPLGYEQVLDELRDTGYTGTELGDWGFMPTDPSALAEALGARGLQLLGAFVPVPWTNSGALAEATEVALRTATLMKEAGFPDAKIVLADDNGTDPLRTRKAGRIEEGEGWSAAQWKEASAAVNRMAQRIGEETGCRCVFHHHAGGFVETPDEVARLLELTDPDLVGLVLDMGHFAFGGGDPLKALTDFSERIWHVHFKDCDPKVAAASRREEWDYLTSVAQGVFCKLGEGSVDFPGIVETLREHNYDGWVVVEQDVLPGMGSPKECATHNRQYLKELGL